MVPDPCGTRDPLPWINAWRAGEAGQSLIEEHELNDAAGALAHLEQAIKLNPPFRKAAQTDADFDPIRGDPEFPAPE
ncbi:MAG: hypothetical protein H0T10_08405 [Actinobacteria bacterium]|nr:hypothetical protein [Actinomycetota bacterium]